ncbi:MAG: LacI family DNA-binding transcriptional regulator [Ancalomicrobiaceae bacterium]|nr:LacI family DNA-binding transcriptional regulator [Ancalomicrobiaceae bacterium]
MAKRITLDHVAKSAGLSPAAVSRYLNGQLVLPSETGRRIDRAVKELGYRPDHRARSLSRGRSDAIGLVIPEIDNPFFSRLAASVERAADARGLGVMLCSTFNKLGRELRYVEMLGIGVVDGLLFATNHHDADGSLARAINDAARIVLVDEDVSGANVSKIFSDNRQGGYLAGRHLIEAGHRRLAYIGGPPDLMSARERAAGLHQAVLESGSDAFIGAEHFGEYAADYGVEAVTALLSGPAQPTAIFVGSDQILIGILRVLAARGVVVGRDLSIVTFDDANTLELLAVPVTAVRQSIDVIGARALDLVVAAVGGANEPRVERVPVDLIVRESVRRLA